MSFVNRSRRSSDSPMTEHLGIKSTGPSIQISLHDLKVVCVVACCFANLIKAD